MTQVLIVTTFNGRHWSAKATIPGVATYVEHAADERTAIMRTLNQVRFEGDPDPAARRRPNLDTP
jgi:hypothetical protein